MGLVPVHELNLARARRWARLIGNASRRNYALRYIDWLCMGGVPPASPNRHLTEAVAAVIRTRIHGFQLWGAST